jgi:hypothetical protein
MQLLDVAVEPKPFVSVSAEAKPNHTESKKVKFEEKKQAR